MRKQHRAWHRLAAATVLVATVLLLPSCGRAYQVVGRVIVASGSESEIRWIAEDLSGCDGDPISGAVARLFVQLSDVSAPFADAAWSDEQLTDADGRFELFAYLNPSVEKLVGLEVNAERHGFAQIVYMDHIDEVYTVCVALLPEGYADA